MNPETQQIVELQLQKLPPVVRTAIKNVDLRAKIATIASKNDLRLDQAGLLEDEMMLVLLGLEHPDTLINNLVTHASLSREIAVRVAEDVNETIFKGIRHLLVEAHEKEKLVEELFAPENQGGLPTTSGPVIVKDLPIVPTTPPSVTPRVSDENIAKAKLATSFHLPPDTIKIKDPVGGGPVGEAPQPAHPYHAGDPYREPVK